MPAARRVALMLALACLSSTALAAPQTGGGAEARAAEDAAEVLAAEARRAHAEAAVAQYRDDVQSILVEAVARGQAYEKLVDLCTTAPHRLSGSPGAAAAVEWSRQAMLDDGLINVRLEPVMVPHWERGSVCSVTVVAPERYAGTDLTALALGGSIATPEHGLVAGVIEVLSFDELGQRAAEAEGKLVFYNRPMDAALFDTFAAYGGAVSQRTRGATEAARVGGIGAIVRSVTTRLDDYPHTGGMRYNDDVARVPTAAISTLAAETLSSMLATARANGEELLLRFEQDPVWHEDEPSFNVVGEIVGREHPEQILVVGGHLDGWDVGQGAHDDGAGTCQSLEAARLLLALDLKPRRTIRVVHFMNEENGLGGAREYHRAHAEEMDRHVFAMESDSGGFSPEGFSSFANPDAMAYLVAIGELMGNANCGMLKRGGGGADVSPMAPDGVVTAGLKVDPARYFDVHHSNRDTLAQVSDREVNLGAGAMAAMLWVLAEMEETLPRNAGTTGG